MINLSIMCKNILQLTIAIHGTFLVTAYIFCEALFVVLILLLALFELKEREIKGDCLEICER